MDAGGKDSVPVRSGLRSSGGVSSTKGVREGLEEVDPSDKEAATSIKRLDNFAKVFLTLDRVPGTRFIPDVAVMGKPAAFSAGIG